ncbi:MAG TPA: HD domain-containing protein [Candidatus Methanoperedens sp.]|nr:HD domain-containing protein [Candidatus Methanoperedens sp.]
MPMNSTRGGGARCGPGRPLRIRGTSPSTATCRRLLVSHGVPEHIRRHSARVAGVARRLASALRKRGERIDVALVEAAALLHDVAKAPCLESRLDHAAEGGRVLRELGLTSVAAVVERHVHLGPWDPRGPVTEAEVVNYADKRVLYEDIVSLEERFRDLIARYSRGNIEFEERIRRNWALMEAVEVKIFRGLPLGPADLGRVRPPRGGARP